MDQINRDKLKVNKILTLENVRPSVQTSGKNLWSGGVADRAVEIQQELNNGAQKRFNKVVTANTGDPHLHGQKPVTFVRQVVALCTYPTLFESAEFAEDAKDRAKRVLSGCGGGSMGSYSNSLGITLVRQDIAKYIEQRDGGIPCDFNNIFISGGGAKGALYSVIKMFTKTPVADETIGVMLPVPTYPAHPIILNEDNAQMIPYYLNESNKWSIDAEELQRSLDEYRDKCTPRAVVIVNPGNPGGCILSRENIEEIIKFAFRERLYIIADEVYQWNVYGETPFLSFKKVMTEMGEPYKHMELASVMSVSKSYTSECGFRCGYCEVINQEPELRNLFFTTLGQFSPNTPGQAVMEVFTNPPKPGEPSHSLFKQETEHILKELKMKARLCNEVMNSVEGVSLTQIESGMFAFPQIQIPAKAIQEAKRRNHAPDEFYCYELLEETGLLVTPGNVQGQKPDTFHFRMVILLPMEELKDVLERFKVFHLKFLSRYK